jgi:hypothetical protein
VPRRRLTLSITASDPETIRETMLREFPGARVVDVRSPTEERPHRTSFVIPTSDGEDAFAIFQSLRRKSATRIEDVRVEELE